MQFQPNPAGHQSVNPKGARGQWVMNLGFCDWINCMLVGVMEKAMSISLAMHIWAMVISFMPGRWIWRSMRGTFWKPILAAHQSGRTSQIFCSTVVPTSL